MTKHAGRALKAGLRIIFWTLVLVLAVLAAGALAIFVSKWIVAISEHMVLISEVLLGLWVVFALFTLYFFRDPRSLESGIPSAIVAPAHGKVDVIDTTTEPEHMGGSCQRISIFLSVLDPHVQRAPISGTLVYRKHRPGKFLSATRSHSAEHNESVLLGFTVKDYAEKKVAVRLVAGMLARRIVLWTKQDTEVTRSERLSLIQFGSRCELFLPTDVQVHVKLGDKVKAGETVLASFA
jgi:phosphatidylserine decarboxylase